MKSKILSAHIDTDIEDVRIDILLYKSSSVSEYCIGIAKVPLQDMIDNSCDIILREIDIVSKIDSNKILGTCVVDVRGEQLLSRCA